MAWKKYFLFLILFADVVLVRCECDSYPTCVGSFINNFFNVNYFKNIKSDSFNNTIKHGEGDFNNVIVNVSGFLQSEWDNNNTIVTHNIFQNIDNDTTVFVRAINIGEDVDFYNIFDENQSMISPEELNTELTLPSNESSIIYEVTNPNNSTFQPLVFNFSEILTPVNFNTSVFPQIKIEHYKAIEKDERENEISDLADFQEYYDFNEDNSTDYPIIDYVDLYKDTTNEIIVSNATERYGDAKNIDEIENVEQFNNFSVLVEKHDVENFINDNNNTRESVEQAIFPWIAAIFVKNDTDDQFNYYCDGALLSNKTVVTAARCIQGSNYSAEANDIIVILGKTSLQATGEKERVTKVEQVYVHENFTQGSENDIAVLSLEDEVEFCESIQPARLGDEEEYDEAYTSGWAFTGELTAIHFQKDSNCDHYLKDDKTFCAAYGNAVTVCPSHGGVYAVQSNSTWYLGIRTSDPTERAICINRPVVFTVLEFYYSWISQFV